MKSKFDECSNILVKDFIMLYKGRLDEEFEERYSFDFSPELWETTAHKFLVTVREFAMTQTQPT